MIVVLAPGDVVHDVATAIGDCRQSRAPLDGRAVALACDLRMGAARLRVDPRYLDAMLHYDARRAPAPHRGRAAMPGS